MRGIKKRIATLFLVFALAMPVVAFMPVNVKAESAKTIVDEETPLAAAEDLCAVHWIILILTVGVGAYTAARVISVTKQETEETRREMV